MSSQSHGHGNTPAAWTLTILALIGSTVSGVAFIIPSPMLFWVGIAVIVVGCVAGQAMRMAGLGAVPARR
jgi:1,4-dihydroxy-2-naphthoate octaprenyltransferase